jgi:hypothetical protein
MCHIAQTVIAVVNRVYDDDPATSLAGLWVAEEDQRQQADNQG